MSNHLIVYPGHGILLILGTEDPERTMNMKITLPDLLVSPEGQSADFVELFFDLIFVFAITQITHLTGQNLDLSQVFHSILIFWMIWWGWTQFTWTLNAANTKHPEIRIGTLIATGIAFVMAVSIDMAFEETVLWFAIPYVAVRVLGLGLQIRLSGGEDASRAAAVLWSGLSITGLAAVLLGAFSDPLSRVWWWLAAILLDMISGLIGGKNEGWNIRAKHFSERHSLIVIIALGETLIVAASAVSSSVRTLDIVLSGGFVVLITSLLWWSYFAWIRESMENGLAKVSGAAQARLARDAFSFLHFPLVCGIIGIAIGFENILSHPEIPLTMPITLSLGGGVILFVGSTAASVWRSSGIVLAPRLFILAVIGGCTYLSIGRHPEFALGLIAACLLVLLIFEWKITWRQFKLLEI